MSDPRSLVTRRHPVRGEVWQVDLNPIKGREQAGLRPAMILSVDKFNAGPAELVIVVPITSKRKNVSSHVAVPKGEAGLEEDSYIKCEQIRSVSKERLKSCMGSLKYTSIESVQTIVRVLLGFH